MLTIDQSHQRAQKDSIVRATQRPLVLIELSVHRLMDGQKSWARSIGEPGKMGLVSEGGAWLVDRGW